MTMRPSILGPLGPFAIKISGLVHSNAQPPSACLPVRCGGGRADASAAAQLPRLCLGRRCPYSADTSKFQAKKRPVSPRQEGPATQILPAGRNCPRKQGCVPRNGGLGGDTYEYRHKPGIHRRRPPAAFCLLCRRGQSRPPRRAEHSPKNRPIPPKRYCKGKNFTHDRRYP